MGEVQRDYEFTCTCLARLNSYPCRKNLPVDYEFGCICRQSYCNSSKCSNGRGAKEGVRGTLKNLFLSDYTVCFNMPQPSQFLNAEGMHPFKAKDIPNVGEVGEVFALDIPGDRFKWVRWGWESLLTRVGVRSVLGPELLQLMIGASCDCLELLGINVPLSMVASGIRDQLIIHRGVLKHCIT